MIVKFTKQIGVCVLFITIFLMIENGLCYTIPEPKLELLDPKGFRVSIPDESGIVLFGFHGSVNDPIEGVLPGDFSADILHSTNGRWVYENKKNFLGPNDILYYWIHVQHGSLGYRSLNKNLKVSTVSSSTLNPPSSVTDRIQTDCVKSKTLVRGGSTVCEGELIFEENFDILNSSIWKREVRIPLDRDDADFVSFQDRSQNLYITTGKLYIMPNLLDEVAGFDDDKIRSGELNFGSKCTGIVDTVKECKRRAALFQILPPIISARIRTKESFSFLFGRVEVRAKLPKGDWLFPQILLEPLANEYGITGYASGQMRVAFIRGNENLLSRDGKSLGGQRLSGGIVLNTGENNRDTLLKSVQRSEHWGNDFHTYSLTWTDRSIQLAVDGNRYATINEGFNNVEGRSRMAPFDKEFFISLGVSAGGISDFPNESTSGGLPKPWDNTDPKAELMFWNDRKNWYRTWSGDDSTLIVDYIRVYAL